MNECPKCKSEYHAGDTECQKCGIIFAKFEQYQAKKDLTNTTPPSFSQQKRPSLIVSVGGGFLIFCVLLVVYAELTGMDKSKPQEPYQKALTRQEQIEASFSSWDGSHRNLTKIIKESMNDPNSYEHDKTTYWDMKDYLIVKTVFRGKNAFGGVVKNSISAKVTLEGKVIEFISQDN